MRKYLQSYDTYTVYGKTWLTLLRLKTPKRVHWKTMKTQICTHELVTFLRKNGRVFVNILGLELAIDPLPQGEFVHYNFLKLHYIRHKIKDVSPLRVAALT